MKDYFAKRKFKLVGIFLLLCVIIIANIKHTGYGFRENNPLSWEQLITDLPNIFIVILVIFMLIIWGDYYEYKNKNKPPR